MNRRSLLLVHLLNDAAARVIESEIGSKNIYINFPVYSGADSAQDM